MIDLALIQIPINDAYVIPFYDKCGRVVGGTFDLLQAHKLGCRLSAGEIEIEETNETSNGQPVTRTSVHRLSHPFESIPSSNSSIAFKIRAGGKNYWPFFEIKGSPAKLLQGHNAFGSSDVDKCVMAPLDGFVFHYPDLVPLLDLHLSTIAQIDCTYTAHTESQFLAKQVIQALRHVSSGQVRASNQSFETTVLWNAGSTHCVREVYLKSFEILRQIEDLEKKIKINPADYMHKQLDALTSDVVQEFSKNAVRFEAKCKKRMLTRLGIPIRVFDFVTYAKNYDGCLIQALWNEGFKDIFNTFKGKDVNVYNDGEVLKRLEDELFTTTKSGNISLSRPKRLFRFFRSIKNEGLQSVMDTSSESTFYRNMQEITSVVPKAYLQNLHAGTTNVIPLIKLINVDFAKQLPVGFVEPASLAEQLTGHNLRLVS